MPGKLVTESKVAGVKAVLLQSGKQAAKRRALGEAQSQYGDHCKYGPSFGHATTAEVFAECGCALQIIVGELDKP